MLHARYFGEIATARRTLLLLHAFPFSSAMWEEVAAALSEDTQVAIVAPDLPGFGASSGAEEWTMSTLAAELYALLRSLQIEHTIVGGLSMGGYAALGYYKEYPDTVTGLILADTKAGADTEAQRDDRESYAKDVLAKGAIVAVERQFDKMLSSEAARELPDVSTRVREWMLAATSQSIAAALRAMARRSDSNELLPLINVPTLVIRGANDAITPQSDMQSMAERIQKADYVEISGAGHLSAVERPAEFIAAVREFIRNLDVS